MKTALVISLQGIGNTVLMTPVISALNERGCSVDVVASDNGSNEILGLCSGIRRTYFWNEKYSAGSNVWRLRAELRPEKYDVAFALYPNGKRENTLLCFVRAAQKIRFTDQRHRFQLLDFLPATHKLPLIPNHDLTNNFRLIQSFEPLAQSGSPSLSVSDDAVSQADEFFSRSNLTETFVIGVHPGGGGTAKRWSADNYQELCRRLAKDQSVSFLIFGSSNEERLVHEIVEGVGSRAVAVCGENLETVAALISRCSLLIANDSALSHIASALQVPVVALWGYTDFHRVAPVNPQGVLVKIDYPCSPCYEFAKGYISDCQYHLKCIKNITVDQVQRIVVAYISALKSPGVLAPETFGPDTEGLSFNRAASGCLQIDLRAA